MLFGNTQIVAGQVAVLFLLIGTGFVIRKLGWINEQGIRQMTTILLMIIAPCIIIDSFQMPYEPELFVSLLIAGGSAILTHLIGIVIGRFSFRGQPEASRKVLRFSIIFSNCGFMCIPILQAVLGSRGVFLGSVYIAVFNIVQWTYGVLLMTGDRKDINLRKALINPGTIGLIIGLGFFITGFKLPSIPAQAVSYLADLNSPVAMLIIGAQMADTRLGDIWKNPQNILVTFYRLLLIPVLVLLILHAFNLDRDLILACLIPACAPTAAGAVLFATRYRQNVALATHTIALTTLLSIVSIPLLIFMTDILTHG